MNIQTNAFDTKELSNRQTTDQLVLHNHELLPRTQAILQLTGRLKPTIDKVIDDIKVVTKANRIDTEMPSLMTLNDYGNFHSVYIYLNAFGVESINDICTILVNMEDKDLVDPKKENRIFCSINIPGPLDISLPEYVELQSRLKVMATLLMSLGKVSVVFYLDTKQDLLEKKRLRGTSGVEEEIVLKSNQYKIAENAASRIQDILSKSVFKNSLVTNNLDLAAKTYASQLLSYPAEA